MRITNTADFIKRANEVHNGYYDYSQTVYVKSNEKVKIICPIHGVFEQTPRMHLTGRGCKQCGRNRTKLTTDEFIRRAKSVHGDKYDYSEVEYIGTHDKVKIICPEHGAFYQTPHCHIISKQNCPKCAAKSGGSKRSGKNNVAHLESVKKKKQNTCIERYGTKTWAESDEGRKKLHDIVTSDEVSSKMIATCQDRYGANMWSQSDEGHERLRDIMSSDDMKTKVRNGYMNTYGVDHYMKTADGREKARANINSEERREKIRNAMYEKYGAYSFFESEAFKNNLTEVQKKMKATMVSRYGVEYAFQSKELLEKAWTTKRKNGTCNSSKPEQTMLLLLQDVFGEDNVLTQYTSDVYPFHCDFYIKSVDLYIELNAHWSHGGHWYNVKNHKDIEQLNAWKQRAKLKGSRYYYAAIDTWTKRDLLKLQTAIDNNLNYLVFWKNDLRDVRDWLKSHNLL